jgi:RNA 2',3'-cyclic 3'-phosphodiesterase
MVGHSKSDTRPERYRLFIAITLPEAVKQAIERAQNEIRTALPAKSIRWTRREQFHLTMRFLGSVAVQDVDRLNEAVRRACAGSGVLQLQAAGIGVFPGVRRPRVVWAGVDDRGGRLAALQRSIEAASAPFTNEPPQEKFSGHITLARCRDISRTEASKLATVVDKLANRSFGEWSATAVEIIRSETLPGGSRYTTVIEIALAAASS